MIRFDDETPFARALDALPGADDGWVRLARERQASLTKPAGSLGRLEDIATFLCGWQGSTLPALDRVQAVVFAGNHGVASRGVSAFPVEVTAQMVANFRNGGAAINQLAKACGAELSVVALDLDRPTGDIALEPAMSPGECLDALNAGAAAVAPDTHLLVVGEMGIANTTPAAALCLQAFGGTAQDWCGRGSGVDEAGVTRKTQAVEAAIALHGSHCTSPFETLRRLGGREIAAMTGAILAARLQRVPVMLDGFICCASIAPLVAAQHGFVDHCLAGHCSAEQAHARLLRHFGLRPLLQLDMRLGEGSGAAVAVHLVRAALAAHNGMATFAQAAVAQAI
ncbi:nicotinate-nucleotide--dimethylbenzimidazole phosphoribosyltransferase [Sphingobium amiense]|uniref:Nicotinate-nucleotide--dimethylbenzimidazole phosphoribosyltransferase n=1 Tax=Sphingobium amiense TaxID=135719 RepID=A0A494W996_9SPHN|nr:nicotinate-nucleotide--dimethylbenzimidazole phosphoribosyltransferase [Sphingobium amiense]BBD99167.1 nicotinate-nucleotide--dimethylbenzimidazole phosphoribosyltransferase [Sphingobium amiense]